MVAVAQPVEHLIVVQEVASSDLVGHPIYPSSKTEKCHVKTKMCDNGFNTIGSRRTNRIEFAEAPKYLSGK